MGYFSNGSQGMDYEGEYCNYCYWGDKPCAVWLAHVDRNYEEANNDKSILHLLIPLNKYHGNGKCKMFIKRERVIPTRKVKRLDVDN